MKKLLVLIVLLGLVFSAWSMPSIFDAGTVADQWKALTNEERNGIMYGFMLGTMASGFVANQMGKQDVSDSLSSLSAFLNMGYYAQLGSKVDLFYADPKNSQSSMAVALFYATGQLIQDRMTGSKP